MASITINDITPRVQYTVGDTASAGPFAIPFAFFDKRDIHVTITQNGQDTELAQSAFTITGTVKDDGYQDGEVTLDNAVANARVTIFRRLAIERTDDFPQVGPFNIHTLNRTLDRLYAIAQENRLAVDRVVRLQPEDDTAQLDFPLPGNRVGKLLGFDDQGRLAGVSPADLDTAISASLSAIQDGQVLIWDASEATFRNVPPRRVQAGVAYTPQMFGAAADGAADDTGAIQQAIDAAGADPTGIVYIPAGIYRVMPAIPANADSTNGDGSALFVRDSDVRLQGDGAGLSILRLDGPNGGDPDSDYDLIDYDGDGQDEVWRGGCIVLTGGQSNVTIAGLELDGRASFTGDSTFPADTSDGDGWDITHKAIWLNPDTAISHVTVRDCHVHNFKGELIYAAGNQVRELHCINCRGEASNGEFCTFSIGSIRDNRVRDMSVGIEVDYGENIDSAADDRIVLAGNDVRGISKDAIAARMTRSGAKAGVCVIRDNVIENCGENGINALDARNLWIRENAILDCGTSWSHGGIRLQQSGDRNRDFDNVHIADNQIVARAKGIKTGINIGLSGYAINKSTIADNVLVQSQEAVDNGITPKQPFQLSNTTIGADTTIAGNRGYGTTYLDVNAFLVFDEKITTAGSNVTVIEASTAVDGVVPIDLFVRVENADTDVRVFAEHADLGGSTRYSDLVPNQTFSGGATRNVSANVFAGAGQAIKVRTLVSKADNVFLSVRVRGL